MVAPGCDEDIRIRMTARVRAGVALTLAKNQKPQAFDLARSLALCPNPVPALLTGRRMPPARLRLVPEALADDLAVSLMMGAEHDVLKAVRPRLESTDLLRRHANRVSRSDLADIVAYLDGP